jgi:hypothetical protein
MRCTGHVARIERREMLKKFVGKPKGKRPFRGRRRRSEDNIKIYVTVLRWEGVDWGPVAGYFEQRSERLVK